MNTLSPSATSKERELRYIEDRAAEAATRPDARRQLSILLARVLSVQADDPRVMGMCLRLSKIIRTHLQQCRNGDVERYAHHAWIEYTEDEERWEAAIERIRHALAAHLALHEVAEVTQYIIMLDPGRLQLPLLRCLLLRIGAILEDARLSRSLRLHVAARIARRHCVTALACAEATSSSSAADEHVSSNVADFTGNIGAVLPHKQRAALKPANNTVRPLEESDSDDYGDCDYGGDFGEGDEDDSDLESALESLPHTPRENALLSPHEMQTHGHSNHASKRDFISIAFPPAPELRGSSPDSSRNVHSHWLSWDMNSSSEDSEDSEVEEKRREAARQVALRKLCKLEWVRIIRRNAKPAKRTKRTRLSRIPSLLTVGEEKEEEDV